MKRVLEAMMGWQCQRFPFRCSLFHTLVFLAVFTISRAAMGQEPGGGSPQLSKSIRLTLPQSAQPGGTVEAVVTVEPSVSFTRVVVIAETPIMPSEVKAAPPFRFTMRIPEHIAWRAYKFHAMATKASGGALVSEPVSLTVEAPSTGRERWVVKPEFIEFSTAGPTGQISAVRIEGNHQSYVSEWSKVYFRSLDPKVVTATREGTVTATGPGRTEIQLMATGTDTVLYTVPVLVRRPDPSRPPSANDSEQE